jgi:hypothetical protein
MKLILSAACVFLCYAPAHLRAAEASPTSASIPVWDPASASAYLDGRINWWMNWPTAARDHCETRASDKSFGNVSVRRRASASG